MSPYLPLPVTTGGRRRVKSLLQHVDRDHQVFFVAYWRGEDPSQVEESRALVSGLHVVERRPTKSLANALRWLVGPWPFMAVANGFSPAMERCLARVVEQVRPDLVHCEHFHMWHPISKARTPAWPPVVLAQQGVEFLVTRRFMGVTRHPLLRMGLAWEERKGRRWEPHVCRSASRVIVVSEEDRRALAAHVDPSRISVVENGVDVGEFTPAPGGLCREPVLLFVGTFSFFGNRDALRRLMTDVFPRVRSIRPDARLVVVGEGLTSRLPEGVVYHGAVRDVVPFFQGARVLVAPLRTGSGTKLKILEAMACGVPFVTTTVGAEGIPEAREAGLVADEACDQVEAILALLGDDERAQALGRAGRRLAVERYSWEVRACALVQAWRQALGEG